MTTPPKTQSVEAERDCLHNGNAGGPEGVVAYRWAQYTGPNFQPHGYTTRFATHISTGPRDKQEELYSEPYVKGLQAELAALRAQSTPTGSEPEPVMTIGIDESEKCRSLPFGMKLYDHPPTLLDVAPVTDAKIDNIAANWSEGVISTTLGNGNPIQYIKFDVRRLRHFVREVLLDSRAPLEVAAPAGMPSNVRDFVGEVADDTTLNSELRAWAHRLIAEDDAASRVPVASVAVGEPELCRTCGESRPFTGTCGTSDGDTKALCKRPTPAPGGAGGDVGAIKELLEKLLLEAELFWWNDGPEGKSASDMHKARDAVLAHFYALATSAASVPAGGEVPKGFALVPLRLTREMDDVLSEEGWQWEDLLAAAGSITEAQAWEIATQPPKQDAAPVAGMATTKTVTESIYAGKSVTIPLALVQHVERRPHEQYMVVMKSSTYNTEFDDYNNAPCLDKEEGPRFMAAWCRYRAELESSTLVDFTAAAPAVVQPAPVVDGGQDTVHLGSGASCGVQAFTPDEILECMEALTPDHDGQDFESECPACTAYQKLAAILATQSTDGAGRGE